MGSGWRSAVRLHVRFTLLLVGLAAALALIGYAPTVNLGGPLGIRAMWVACGLTALASSLAALPVTLARLRPDRTKLVAVQLGSLALRMALVVLLAGAVLLSGAVDRKPFLLWVAISYLVLLPLDVWYALEHSKQFSAGA